MRARRDASPSGPVTRGVPAAARPMSVRAGNWVASRSIGRASTKTGLLLLDDRSASLVRFQQSVANRMNECGSSGIGELSTYRVTRGQGKDPEPLVVVRQALLPELLVLPDAFGVQPRRYVETLQQFEELLLFGVAKRRGRLLTEVPL